MDGLFLENGPFRVNKNLSLSVNEGGWQNYATNIFCMYFASNVIRKYHSMCLFSGSACWYWI